MSLVDLRRSQSCRNAAKSGLFCGAGEVGRAEMILAFDFSKNAGQVGVEAGPEAVGMARDGGNDVALAGKDHGGYGDLGEVLLRQVPVPGHPRPGLSSSC